MSPLSSDEGSRAAPAPHVLDCLLSSFIKKALFVLQVIRHTQSIENSITQFLYIRTTWGSIKTSYAEISSQTI